MIHPFIKNKKYFLIYMSVWIMFSIIQALILFFKFDLDFTFAIADSFIYNISFSVFASVVWYMSSLNSFRPKELIAFFSQHLIAGGLIIYLWVAFSNSVITFLIDDQVYLNLALETKFWRYVIGVFYYIIIALIFSLLHYNEDVKIELKQMSSFEKTAIQSELKALKSQLNPHFLFNSLNSISYLTLSDGVKAHEMLIKLSNYMRYAIGKNEKHFTSLKEEINNAIAYIDIEKVRFEERINFLLESDSELENIEVPHMILQPLLENSIKYGVYESDKEVCIKLSTFKENKLLKIKIENDFIKDSRQHKGEGIGLKNIRDRLRLLYSSNNLMNIKKTEKSFTVSISIPYIDQKTVKEDE